MPFVGTRSAIVVPIQLPKALESIRLAHVDNARLGVPAHVTLLFPFVPPSGIDPPVLVRLAETIVRTPCFGVAFKRVETFDGSADEAAVAWLAPDPAEPFKAMTADLVDAFPGYLPYGGIHDDVIPHLTLANVDVDVATVRADARTSLPFRRTVAAAALLVEDLDGRWRIAGRMLLG